MKPDLSLSAHHHHKIVNQLSYHLTMHSFDSTPFSATELNISWQLFPIPPFFFNTQFRFAPEPSSFKSWMLSHQVRQTLGTNICCCTGIELTFFIAACMVPCFGFVTRTVLITHQCFDYFWSVLAPHQGFSFSHSTPQGK